MKIKPLFDRIVVSVDEKNTSAGGIFIGAEGQDKPKVGTVLYSGEGNENTDGKKTPMYVNVGDKVLYNKFSGVEATIDNKQVIILRQTDILAVVE